MNEVPTPPETLPEAVKPRFGRKLYLVIGLVAIAIIVTASVIVFTWFIPGTRGETVPLGFNYGVGEKMTYVISMTVKAMGTETSQEGTLEMEVQSFDGENYTIRQTMALGLSEFSFAVKMNRMGNVIEYMGFPPIFEESSSLFSVPGFGSFFSREEVRVGESWEIPIDIEMTGMDLEGTISYKLSEIASVTIPAGTYETLKINIEPSDFNATYSLPKWNFSSYLTSNINGHIYLEKGTCRLIEHRFDQSVTVTAMGQTESMEITMQMRLKEHIK